MVSLVPISEQEFQRGLEAWILYYAEEKVKAGTWKKQDAL